MVTLADRQRLEAQEALTCAPYATFSARSRGRFHHDHEPSYRTAFQRDRDRIIHSAAFRRLEYKTQVFVNDAGDYYRTRLTHTLEVAQIGRTLARALRVNEDLTEAICLAHDLGHPPFGHAGEAVLDRLLSEWGGFNHNHQSYRVVTELEQRYPQWPGLNLAYETLEGIAKHETHHSKSYGQTFADDKRGSLEAQIANLADELAYNAHDLDDGLLAGLLSLDQLQELRIWRLLQERLNWNSKTLDEVMRHRFIRELVGLLVDDVLQASSARLEALQPQSLEAIQAQPHDLIGYSDEVSAMNAELKAFLSEHMYHHHRIVRMALRAELFISRLYEGLLRDLRQLPMDYRRQVDDHGPQRTVADYIASMTDRSALLEYRHLFDPLMLP
ncbi:MAG: deoxyguanosinetriphosphate triphosphohydrolase [Anaerolineae bacterium]|nr:deoxyguanosinetriphosphate triphosphohydrolase [Anaerolineae bacterium]MDW8173252.1 deoxyguanosinetriphosphate triphosphohydrolase [Anaerolineae bacterium]